MWVGCCVDFDANFDDRSAMTSNHIADGQSYLGSKNPRRRNIIQVDARFAFEVASVERGVHIFTSVHSHVGRSGWVIMACRERCLITSMEQATNMKIQRASLFLFPLASSNVATSVAVDINHRLLYGLIPEHVDQ